MSKSKAFGPARRLVSAGAITAFCAGASFAAWAAQPAALQLEGAATNSTHAAHAFKGGGRLTSDKQTIYGPPFRLVADGHVFYVSTRGSARADHAVYEGARNTLTLTGNVVQVHDQKELRARILVIDNVAK